MEEMKLIKFAKENNAVINQWLEIYVNLFNKAGEETDNEKIQLGLTSMLFTLCLKQVRVEKRQKQQCLANVKVD